MVRTPAALSLTVEILYNNAQLLRYNAHISREVFMARIKHIAIRTPDPEKTAAFYKEVFGLEEVGLARSGYYLSDGYINLAILKSSDQGTGESPRDVPGYAGIDHLGFLVENVDETCKKLEEAGASAGL